MPVQELNLAVPASGNDDARETGILAEIESLILNAGAKLVAEHTDHNPSGFDFARVYRWPSYDALHSSADTIALYRRGDGFQIRAPHDFDPQVAPGTSSVEGLAYAGGWTGGDWPNSGNPAITALNGIAQAGVFSYQLDSGVAYTLRAIASEHGLFVVLESTEPPVVAVFARPLGDMVPGRLLQIDSPNLASASLNFAAPSGAFDGGATQHLRFAVDGQAINVLLPAGGISIERAAQVITMAGAGALDVLRRDEPLGVRRLRVRYPPDRAPSAGVPASVTAARLPQLALVYQDPECVAGGLDFRLIGDLTPDSVTVGALGRIASAGANFVGLGVRIGAYVYNQTTGDTARVVGFVGGSAVALDADTVVLDVVPAGWTKDHAYDVLPFIDQLTGQSSIGGRGVCVRSGAEDASLVPPATALVGLAGEALGHFQQGQTVEVSNNGYVVDFALVGQGANGVVGGMLSNTTTGAKGIVRAIVGDQFFVDTLENSANPGAAPWNNGDVIESVAEGPRPDGSVVGGVASLVRSSTTRGGLGWTARVAVSGAPALAKDTVGGAPNDYRLAVPIVADSTPNPGFTAGPGSLIGSLAKRLVVGGGDNNNAVGNLALVPVYVGPRRVVFDPRFDERESITAAVLPDYSPDVETGGADLSIIATGQGGGVQGYMTTGSLAHFRAVNSANVPAGSVLYEDGDVTRQWYVTESAVTESAETNAPGLVAVGPGSGGLT